MALPKVNDWPDKVRHAGTVGGFNILRDLAGALQEAIPDLKNFEIGLFVEEDLKNIMPIGWRYMTLEHLDFKTVDDFNRTVGLRYGLVVDANSHIKVGDNFIMIMPKKYRELVVQERQRALDKQNALADAKAAYVHPNDPNFAEMKAAAEEIAEGGAARAKVQVRGEPDRVESKRGQPPE